MENENKKSNKTLLVVLVVVVLLAVVVAVLYFSGVFTKKDEKDSSNTNTNTNTNSQSNTNSNDNELANYPKPVTTTNVTLNVCIQGTIEPTLSIENGKVVLTNTKGEKTTDTSIKGEVVAIVSARTTCSCDIPRDTAVLTKEGEAYLFVGYPEYDEREPFLKFEKIKSDKKIIGIAGLKMKSPSTCSDENLYVFTSEKEAYIIETNYDGQNYLPTLGKTYQELYPYQDWLILFDDFEKMVLYYSDKRVKINDSEYLMFEGKDLHVKGIFPKTANEQEANFLLVDDSNSLYTLIFTKENEKLKYTITKDKKVVKDINIPSSEDGNYNITIQYTDGSKEELKKVWKWNFIGKKIER